MTQAGRDRRVFELFQEALDRPEDERESFLGTECGDDAELLNEVLDLLAEDARDDTAVSPLISSGRRNPPSMIGERIGPYEIKTELGQGGMGTVYVARREDVEVEVALKVIREGRLASRERVDRFLLERRVLARLDHPNVARLLDAGVTGQGLPYFAMEYVRGVPITEYCKAQRLPVRGLLELFGQVCDAVQYAHGRLVVHRDLKPSNILVRDDGTVKLLDFGIAKLLEDDPLAPTATRTGTMLMTPEYAAPEQAQGEPVTTATDVYALGVILYQLLCGQLPFNFETLTLPEIVRMISDTRPRRPSAAVEQQSLQRSLKGDLDTIVMQALRKEPERRYASVGHLAEDIRRHLNYVPLTARGDSLAYTAGKFIRRHRAGVGVAVLLAAVLLTLGVREKTLRAAADRSRDEARIEAERAEYVSEFLTDLFEVSDPSRARGETITARQLLDTGALRIDSELADQPELRSRLMFTIGSVYGKLGLYDSSEPLMTRALETARAEYGDEHAGTIRAMAGLANLYR